MYGSMADSAAVLDVRDLGVTLFVDGRELPVVSNVSFSLRAGETLALVGESGAGKSMTALAIMGLAGKGSRGEGVRLSGEVWLDAGAGGRTDLVAISRSRMRSLRGRALSMVFQEPMTSLNPVFRVGWQIAEVIVCHERVSWSVAEGRARELLALVGIPDAARRARAFPHELSGGMRQRVMIAMALACRPRLLVADEPTTALDVTVQAQVLDLVRRVQRELGMAVLFITHDLGVVAQVADRVAVMYAGRIVEESGVHELFAHPRHPYTAGLLGSMPNAAASAVMAKPIPGAMPSLHRLPSGCPFHPRCASADDRRCSRELPPLERTGEGRTVRCFRWAEVSAPYARVA
jgi:oligopeptide/dipeptide ABC transporter ATP-binding protein